MSILIQYWHPLCSLQDLCQVRQHHKRLWHKIHQGIRSDSDPVFQTSISPYTETGASLKSTSESKIAL